MSHRTIKGFAGAAGVAALLIGASPAFSHVFVGNRFFPATLLIDDPGANDEMSLPTFAYITNPDGSQQFDFSADWSKRITPDFAIQIGDTFSHINNPHANGWQNFETSLKYVLLKDAEHEFIFSVGVGFEWGHTGNASVGAEPYTAWTPQIFFGKGAGDLPTSFDALRPFAVTGQMGVTLSTHPVNVTVAVDPDTGANTVNIEQTPTFFNWGFSLQYSLPYMNSNVLAIDNDFLKHLIPLVEVSFSTPVANIGPPGNGNSHITTGTVNPGILYVGSTFQIGVEAMLPVNSQSGKHVGVLAQLHLYLDDLFPDTIGRPLFAPEGYVSARSPFSENYAEPMTRANLGQR